MRVQAHFRRRQLRAAGAMSGAYGLAFVGDCSSVLGTNNAPFSKYPGATGLWRVRNTGTEPWPPGGIILHPDGGPGLQVPPSLPEPVLSGEEAVVGVLRGEALLGDLPLDLLTHHTIGRPSSLSPRSARRPKPFVTAPLRDSSHV